MMRRAEMLRPRQDMRSFRYRCALRSFMSTPFLFCHGHGDGAAIALARFSRLRLVLASIGDDRFCRCDFTLSNEAPGGLSPRRVQEPRAPRCPRQQLPSPRPRSARYVAAESTSTPPISSRHGAPAGE